MCQLIVDLNLSWKQIVINAKDFTALADILSRAQVVDRTYLKTGSYAVKQQWNGLEARTLTLPVVTEAEYSALKAEADKAEATTDG